MAVWLFVLNDDLNDQPCWHWVKNTPNIIESAHTFRSFEDCVSNARTHGFDFRQPHHFTSTRHPLVVK